MVALGYGENELAHFAAAYAATPWMVHVSGSDEVYLYSDETDEVEGETEYTEQTAHAAAAAINQVAARVLADGNEYTPHLHATVFHHGLPVQSTAASR